MCVLTYIPTKNGEYIITNNRDENPSRPAALAPQLYEINGVSLTFPKDPLGGGTWIASTPKTNLVLLNGGHRIHKHKPPYRQSRGKVILDFFEFEDVNQFFKDYQFEGIEPFTLVIISDKIHEIRWDEDGKTLQEFSKEKPKIWSSVTLYSPEIIIQREEWFNDFLTQNPFPNKEIALEFHKTGGDGNKENSLNMERGDLVRTLGISQVVCEGGESEMEYFVV